MKNIFENKKGMSLVELIIASVIVTLLLGAISVAAFRSFYLNRYLLEQGLNNSALRNSLRGIERDLREAKQADSGSYMIQLADDFELIFFADIDNDSITERIHYYLENNQLKKGITKPTGFPSNYSAEDMIVKIVGQGIINTSSQPLFFYYNKNYPTDVTNNPLKTPATPAEVSLIQISIFANINPNHVPDSMHLETFVRPRNFSH